MRTIFLIFPDFSLFLKYMPLPKKSSGKLRPLQLAAIIFLTVSGGPYGLEPLFTYVGTHGALLLLLVTPFLWDVPSILTVLELNAMMPVTGGYYQWVKHALGLRWAFFEGWWTWLYTFLDLAIYPVLFVSYAAFFFPEMAHYKIPVCLIIIWSSALLNILGIVPVGKASVLLSLVVLIPFGLIFLCVIHPAALVHPPTALAHSGVPLSSFTPSMHGLGLPAISMGLYTVMWNFLGWDNATTYAGEVARPVRSYLTSICIAFILVFALYLLTAYSVHRSGIDPAVLNDGGFPVLGVLTGGRWLGIVVAIGGMAGQLGLYSAVLLSVSRVPQVMADDQLLPAWFCTLHPRFGTPYVSIIASSAVVSVLVLFTFSDLIVMDIILYGAGLSLEFIALLVLRRREPDTHRPFRIPLGNTGLILLFLLPIGIYIVAISGILLASEKAGPALLALAMLFSAAVAWQFIRKRKRPLPIP
jgi:amino acid transporter